LVEDNLKRLSEHHLDLVGLRMGNFSLFSSGQILVNKVPDEQVFMPKIVKWLLRLKTSRG
jgi:hypothetical protein